MNALSRRNNDTHTDIQHLNAPQHTVIQSTITQTTQLVMRGPHRDTRPPATHVTQYFNGRVVSRPPRGTQAARRQIMHEGGHSR